VGEDFSIATVSAACYINSSATDYVANRFLNKEQIMPVISITMGETSQEQKKQLIERLTAEAVAVTKIGAEHFTVTITELSYHNLGLGGKTVASIRAAGQ
jgi:4-oxalocrotonate tautomerase